MTVTMRSPLSEHSRRETGDTLQSALVDLLDMSLIAKQVHWNIVGPRFRSIHLQLDDLVSTARSYADTIAERASAIGVSPDGRAETIARTSGLTSIAEGWTKDSDVVALVVRALGEMIGRLRERIDATEKTDLVTQDIYIGLAADLEKHHWMFQATQEEG